MIVSSGFSEHKKIIFFSRRGGGSLFFWFSLIFFGFLLVFFLFSFGFLGVLNLRQLLETTKFCFLSRFSIPNAGSALSKSHLI
jgi:hypothetical protein